MNATINTKGDRVSVLTQGLQGIFDFAIADGALKGVNIGEKLREVRAKIQRESYTPLSTAKKTDFAEMEGDGDIKDGVVSLRKIEMASPLLRADVKGNADLVNELLDVYVNAYLVGTTTGQDGRELDEVRRVHAPLTVKGKFDAPEIKVDWDALLKSDTLDELEAKKDAAQAKLDQQRKAAQEALAKERAELKLKEDAKRAELDAKRKAEEEALKKRLEDKKKEKLKDLFR
jgi:AsmA protein